MATKPRSRVLCANNRRSTLAQWHRLLRDEFDVMTVEGGRAVVDAAMRFRPDALVIDIVMPDLDGIAAAKLILESNPRDGFIR